MTGAAMEATSDGITRGDLTVLIVACALLTIVALILTIQGNAAHRQQRRDLDDLRRSQATRTALSRAARRDLHHATKDLR